MDLEQTRSPGKPAVRAADIINYSKTQALFHHQEFRMPGGKGFQPTGDYSTDSLDAVHFKVINLFL
jgi:hypothetical protein